jgi:hypothetical protein
VSRKLPATAALATTVRKRRGYCLALYNQPLKQFFCVVELEFLDLDGCGVAIMPGQSVRKAHEQQTREAALVAPRWRGATPVHANRAARAARRVA